MNIVIDGLKTEYEITESKENEGVENKNTVVTDSEDVTPETVVILEGWGTCIRTYDVITNELSKRHRVIVPDFPGFGKSDEPTEPWDVSKYADFIAKFLNSVGVKDVILIGHSFGGRIIIKLAAKKNPNIDIKKIVLIDSAGIVPKKTFLQKVKIKKYKIVKRLAELKISRFFYGTIIDEWKKNQGSADYRQASPVMKGCLVKAVNEDLTGALSEVSAETLLVWGEKDTATPLSDGIKMKEKIPSSTLHIVKDAGHYPFLTNTEEVLKTINSFL